MHHRSYAIVEAPSILGLKPTGVDQLPQRCSVTALPSSSRHVSPRERPPS